MGATVPANETSTALQSQQPAAQQFKVTVLAVSSLQILLLVIVGSTGFILSIVSNLVPARFKAAAPLPVRRASSPPASSSSSSATARSSRRSSSSVTKQPRPKLSKRDSDSIPELVHDGTSDDDASVDTADHPVVPQSQRQLSPPAVLVPTGSYKSKHVQLQESSHSTSVAKACAGDKQSRRTSLDLVRHTLHIPPRSPPASRAGSITSPDRNEKSHCPRPKIGRLFSSSSREPSPPPSEAEGSEAGAADEKRPGNPQRKMSLKLGSGFRSSKSHRASSEADAVDIKADSAANTLVSPPVSPTGPSSSKALSNLRNFLGSPSSKPKVRRAASEQIVIAPMSRHQLMAEARKDREREARLYAEAHAESAERRRTSIDMSGKSQLTMQEHFA